MTDNNLNSTDLDQLPELTKKDEKEIQKMINRLDEENIDDAEPVNSDSCLARLPAKKILTSILTNHVIMSKVILQQSVAILSYIA